MKIPNKMPNMQRQAPSTENATNILDEYFDFYVELFSVSLFPFVHLSVADWFLKIWRLRLRTKMTTRKKIYMQ